MDTARLTSVSARAGNLHTRQHVSKPVVRGASCNRKVVARSHDTKAKNVGAAGGLAVGLGLLQSQAAFAEEVAGTDSSLAAIQQAAAAVEEAAVSAQKAAADSPMANAVEEAANAIEKAAATMLSEGKVDGVVVSAVDGAAVAIEQAAAAVQDAATDGTILKAVQQAATALQGAAASLSDLAEPAFKAGLVEASKALEGLNVDTAAISETTGAAAGVAKQVSTFVANTSPTALAYEALALTAAVYLAPSVGKAALKSLRGYAGDVLPTSALDALVSQGNNALVDIRTSKEKEAVGVPDLADAGKYVELEFVAVGDNGLQSRLRNASEVEAESTAIQIAGLKQLNKGMTVYIMDNKGATCKAVARELGKRGFSKVFVMTGGYQAWTGAKLKTKSWEATSAKKGLLPSPKVTMAASS